MTEAAQLQHLLDEMRGVIVEGRAVLAEQAGIALEQRYELRTATSALVDVAAELRATREDAAARDEHLDGRIEALLNAQGRILDILEATDRRLDDHEQRLEVVEQRADGHDEALVALAEAQAGAKAEADARLAKLAGEVELAKARAKRLASWRLVGAGLCGAALALVGAIVGAWAKAP